VTKSKNPRNPKVFIVNAAGTTRLVKALSVQSAIKHTVQGTHSARPAKVEDLLANPELTVEDATVEQPEELGVEA
jgi:stage III sporulation protein SpoIIIAA